MLVTCRIVRCRNSGFSASVLQASFTGLLQPATSTASNSDCANLMFIWIDSYSTFSKVINLEKQSHLAGAYYGQCKRARKRWHIFSAIQWLDIDSSVRIIAVSISRGNTITLRHYIDRNLLLWGVTIESGRRTAPPMLPEPVPNYL